MATRQIPKRFEEQAFRFSNFFFTFACVVDEQSVIIKGNEIVYVVQKSSIFGVPPVWFFIRMNLHLLQCYTCYLYLLILWMETQRPTELWEEDFPRIKFLTSPYTHFIDIVDTCLPLSIYWVAKRVLRVCVGIYTCYEIHYSVCLPYLERVR